MYLRKSMARPKVYVTRQIFPEALDVLNENVDAEIFEGDENPIPRSLLLEKVKNINGLLCLITERIDREVFEAGKNLEIISNCAVGYNNIDVAEATRRGIYVTNTPGILTETTADCAFALMMAITRRIVEGDKNIRAKKWVNAWGLKMFIGADVHGKTLGIVGLGRIGVAMTHRAKGFNMKVLYYDVVRRKDLETQLGVEYQPLSELLANSDFVSIHVPLTEDTTHLIGRNELAMMKRTAYLVNTSRGSVVDEAALYDALSSRVIAGAALDVFEKEPIDFNNKLIELDNIVITPHIASASIDTRTAMAVMAARSLVSALQGNEPPNCVNPEAGKNRARTRH
jgi:glyoxylate reductase